jgi:hypothetical protein
LILAPCIIEYVENVQLNALNYILLCFSYDGSYMFRKKKCHHQGATVFHSEPHQRQYGRRQVIGRMAEPTYRRAM